jgi:fatty acid desaturase
VGSQPGGSHETPVVDWVAVYIMLIGASAIGLALPLKSWWLGIAGGVVLVIGVGIAMAYGIMNHTEDYEVFPRALDPDEGDQPPTHTKRIISA